MKRFILVAMLAVGLVLGGSFLVRETQAYYGNSSGQCYTCEGRGWIICYTCNGRGIERTTNSTCYSCYGRGYLKCMACGGKGWH